MRKMTSQSVKQAKFPLIMQEDRVINNFTNYVSRGLDIFWDFNVFKNRDEIDQFGGAEDPYKVSSKISYSSFFWFPFYLNKINQSINRIPNIFL